MVDPESTLPAVYFSLGNIPPCFPLLSELNTRAETTFPDTAKDHIMVGISTSVVFGRQIFMSLDEHVPQVPGVTGSFIYSLQFLNEQRSSLADVVFFVDDKCYLGKPL